MPRPLQRRFVPMVGVLAALVAAVGISLVATHGGGSARVALTDAIATTTSTAPLVEVGDPLVAAADADPTTVVDPSPTVAPDPATTTSAVAASPTTPPTTGAAIAPKAVTSKPTTKPTSKPTTTTTRPRPAAALTTFGGLGAWVDAFDWTQQYAAKNRVAAIGPETVDQMAAQGVQVLYIQTARYDADSDVLEPDTLRQWIDRAHLRGIRVVAWYLPTFDDQARDLRRSLASARLGVEGFGLDVEYTRGVPDHDERSARLVALSQALRGQLGATFPMSAITLPNVVTDVINLNYWPRFPWLALKPLFQVWQPMGYWTNRKPESGYRDAERYTNENIRLLRAQLQDPAAPVSMVGGIGDKTTTDDIAGFRRACTTSSCIGGSLYDWRTQAPPSYAPMRAFRI